MVYWVEESIHDKLYFVEILISLFILGCFAFVSAHFVQLGSRKAFILQYLNKKKLEVLYEEIEKNEKLLAVLIPSQIIERLKKHHGEGGNRTSTTSRNSLFENTKAQDFLFFHHKGIAVGFIKILEFEKIESMFSALDIFNLLNRVFTLFDLQIQRSRNENVHKIKQIGELYMFASGHLFEDCDEDDSDCDENNDKELTRIETHGDIEEVTFWNSTCHRNLHNALNFSFDVLESLEKRMDMFRKVIGFEIGVSIGISCGEVISGVTSLSSSPMFDLWSDVCNMASRATHHNKVKNSVHLEKKIFDRVENVENDFMVDSFDGHICDIKGKGRLKFYNISQRINKANVRSGLKGSSSDYLSDSGKNKSEKKSKKGSKLFGIGGGSKKSTTTFGNESSSSILGFFERMYKMNKTREENEKLFLSSFIKNSTNKRLSMIPYEMIAENINDVSDENKHQLSIFKTYIPFLNVFRNKKINEIYHRSSYKVDVEQNRVLFVLFFIFHVFSVLIYVIKHSNAYFYISLIYGIGSLMVLLLSFVAFTPFYKKNFIVFQTLNIITSLTYLSIYVLIEVFVGITKLNILLICVMLFQLTLSYNAFLKLIVIVIVIICNTTIFIVYQNVTNGLQIIPMVLTFLIGVVSMFVSYLKETRDATSFYMLGLNHKSTLKSNIEHQKSEELLKVILPGYIISKLQTYKDRLIADYYENVSFFFCDFVQFTKYCESRTPLQIVKVLHTIFSKFNDTVRNYPLTPGKTVGDNWNCVGGAPITSTQHSKHMAFFALEIQEMLNTDDFFIDNGIKMRMGIHSGPVIAGIAGSLMFRWDFAGITVKIAELMEQTGEPNRIHVSYQFKSELSHSLESYRFVKTERVITFSGKNFDSFFLEKQ